jgi:hypothetical protein
MEQRCCDRPRPVVASKSSGREGRFASSPRREPDASGRVAFSAIDDLASMTLLPYAGHKSRTEERQEADVHELDNAGRARFRAAPNGSGRQHTADQQHDKHPFHFFHRFVPLDRRSPTNEFSIA